MSNITRYTQGIPSLLGRSVWDDFFAAASKDPEILVRRSTEGYPVTDIYIDDDQNSIIECALAGFTKDQLSIESKEGRITITADGGGDEEAERRIARRSFSRSYVDTSGKLNLNKAEASFADGLLRVVIPPIAEAKAKTIAIS